MNSTAAQQALIRTAEKRMEAYLGLLGLMNRGLFVAANGDAVFFAPKDSSGVERLVYDAAVITSPLEHAKKDFGLDGGTEDGFAYNGGDVQGLQGLCLGTPAVPTSASASDDVVSRRRLIDLGWQRVTARAGPGYRLLRQCVA